MTDVQVGAVAPVVPVVPASTDAPEIVSTADTNTEIPEGEPKPEPKPERTFTQKEVNEIAARRAAQAERQALKVARAEVERDLLRKQLEERNTQQRQSQDGEPEQKDFKDFDSWNRAQIAYHVKRGVQEAMSGREKESTAQEQARMEAQRGEMLRQKFAAAEAKYPDFREQLADPDLPFNGAILAYIEDSAIGGDVAYHLANDRAEASRIAGLTPIKQVLALQALEAKLSAPPKPTQTSAPIVPNKGNSAGSKSMLDMNQEEFEKHRAARLKRK